LDAKSRLEVRRLVERKAGRGRWGPVSSPAIAHYFEARYGHHEMNLAATVRDEARQARKYAVATEFYRREAEQLS
jgi:uncharacterized protein